MIKNGKLGVDLSLGRLDNGNKLPTYKKVI
jgi:hypothetical protein